MTPKLNSLDDVVRLLRSDPARKTMVHEAFLGSDLEESSRRFSASAEFAEVVRLLGDSIRGGTIIDLGAGTGIASSAFLDAGAQHVHAIEPDPSELVGRGALGRMLAGRSASIHAATGESLPFPDCSIDLVYCRQVLHHVTDLAKTMKEIYRVLRPGGRLLACREHVCDNKRQLLRFLRKHPVHQLIGGEHAFPLPVYRSAIASAGMTEMACLGPWQSIINAYPVAKNTHELACLPKIWLARRGFIGRIFSYLPGIQTAVRLWLDRPFPGRLYTFFACRPL